MFDIIITHLEVPWQILGAAFLVSLVVYLSVRFGSAQVLHLALWRVLFTGRPRKDAEIERWMSDRNALSNVALSLYDVRVRSLAVSKRMGYPRRLETA